MKIIFFAFSLTFPPLLGIREARRFLDGTQSSVDIMEVEVNTEDEECSATQAPRKEVKKPSDLKDIKKEKTSDLKDIKKAKKPIHKRQLNKALQHMDISSEMIASTICSQSKVVGTSKAKFTPENSCVPSNSGMAATKSTRAIPKTSSAPLRHDGPGKVQTGRIEEPSVEGMYATDIRAILSNELQVFRNEFLRSLSRNVATLIATAEDTIHTMAHQSITQQATGAQFVENIRASPAGIGSGPSTSKGSTPLNTPKAKSSSKASIDGSSSKSNTTAGANANEPVELGEEMDTANNDHIVIFLNPRPIENLMGGIEFPIHSIADFDQFMLILRRIRAEHVGRTTSSYQELVCHEIYICCLINLINSVYFTIGTEYLIGSSMRHAHS